MAQGVLPFQYKEQGQASGLTALGGLPAYLDLAQAAGLRDAIRRHLSVRPAHGQGWNDEQIVMALILLNLSGGDCVADLERLEADEGLCRVMRRVEHYGLPRAQRRSLERRWRKQRRRAFPSASPVFRYLAAFHDEEQEQKRLGGTAFIPAPNAHLQALGRVNRDFIAFVQSRSVQREATLDMDATLVGSEKAGALWCYDGYRAYQPFNVYWAQQELVVHSEFRDGNVPAGHQQLRLLQETLEQLPEGVEKVQVRSDTAGYQQELLRYCAEGRNERFGVIEFAIGADVSESFRNAVAEVEESEWAEVCYVPSGLGHCKSGPDYRYLAIREPLHRQLTLPEHSEVEPPSDNVESGDGGAYKIRGIVTNRSLDGNELIAWYRQRCGKSEEIHAVMKDDLAGGKLPSGDFGENAAWWGIMILALNLNSAMKRLVLPASWRNKRFKALRFGLIHLAGQVRERSRQLEVLLSPRQPALPLLRQMREKIVDLARGEPLAVG
ncbi:IS1380 family transposase [Trichloromonas sp.]|uniref:IS1380 family transposase n=1 Tax=Trichloromonas sp. TaxID=3069249 RepID=UPI002A3AA19E|nr:IS1380 family transposase [Trichloromonas sp.]